MKTFSPGRLDQDTPKWPKVRTILGTDTAVTVHGVLIPVDDKAAAITRCAEQAAALGWRMFQLCGSRRVGRCFSNRARNHAHMGAKVGRKSKGDRDAFALRPLRPLGDRIRANADALGMSYNDYVIGIMADAVGMPEYAPIRLDAAGQLDLPIDRMTA